VTDQPDARPERQADELTSRGLLARNMMWNALGLASPLVAAVIAVPFLIDAFGNARFGIIALAWALIGGFSLFDLGFGRALTQETALTLGRGRESDLPPVLSTYLAMMVAIGFAGTLILAALAHPLAYDILNLSPSLRGQTEGVFYCLAIALPFVILTTGLRGVLEAYQRFAVLTAIRVPMNVFTLAAPLAVAPFTRNLFVVAAALALSRVVAVVVHLVLCIRVAPPLRRVERPRWELVRPIVRSASWMTVTTTVSPLMLYPDRFFVGALLSAIAIAFYATPHEIVTKLAVLPLAPIAVLFPAFATTFTSNPARTGALFRAAAKYLLLAMLPLTLVLVTYSHELIEAWLGSEFARQSSRVLEWLAIGALIQAPAQVAFALLLGVGRADLVAKLLVVELPLYLGGLWLAIVHGGLEGAALAWLVRAGLDALVLLLMASWFLAVPRRSLARAVAVGAIIVGQCVILALLPAAIVVRSVVLVVALAGALVVAWNWMLNSSEKRWLRRPFTAPQAAR